MLKKFIGDKGGCTITKPTFQETNQDNPLVSKPKKMKEMAGFSNRGLTKNVFYKVFYPVLRYRTKSINRPIARRKDE